MMVFSFGVIISWYSWVYVLVFCMILNVVIVVIVVNIFLICRLL